MSQAESSVEKLEALVLKARHVTWGLRGVSRALEQRAETVEPQQGTVDQVAADLFTAAITLSERLDGLLENIERRLWLAKRGGPPEAAVGRSPERVS